MSILRGGSSTTCTLLVLVIILYQCTSTMAEFAEVPANVMAELGAAIPPCRCRHTSSDALINWIVNGLSVGRFPDIRSGSINEDGNTVYTLTIPAEPQYNATVVVCVASFLGGSPTDMSPAATILLFTPTVSIPETTHFETNPTNTPPDITEIPINARPGITENPTNTRPGITNFVITPSSLTVAVEQETAAAFPCQHPLADAIGWTVNGISLNSATLQNISATITPNGVHILLITSLFTYHGATIECVAVFIDGSSPQFTPPAILLIQGPLDPVSNVHLARGTSTLFWTPPPTLDLTGVDPDIAYCVDIYNITCGRRDLIISDCGVTDPIYTSNASGAYIYEYIVTPRSNVEGARNGTPSQRLRDRFSRFSDSISERNSFSTRNVQLAFLNLEPNRPVPSSYTVLLESLDGLEDVMLKTTSVTTEGDVVVVDLDHRLPLNRVWNCTLLAYGCRQNILSNVELSTHDIQNVSISSHIPGQIRVTGEFFQGSSATGVLVTIVNATDLEHHLISRDDSGNGIDGIISGLPGGQYTVSVFVISENGLPFERAATKPRRITVKNAVGPVGDHPSPTIKYKLDQIAAGVHITCTFLESSTTDCVAVVHQRISQLNSSGLMNIESSHKFTRSDDTADGDIEEIDMEQYQVGVIDGKMIITEPQSNQRDSSLAGAITGVILALAGAMIVAVTVVVIVLYKKRHKIEVTHPSGSQAQNNIGRDSATENHYAESAGLLLPCRVEDDGGLSLGMSTSHVSGSADHGTHISPIADNGSDEPTTEPPPLPPRFDDSAPVSESGTSASPHQIPTGDRTPNIVQESADCYTHTSPTADGGVSDPPGRPPEECPPPLPPRLMDDGTSTPHSADQSTPHQVTSDNGTATYVSVLTTTPHAVSQPATTEKVSYEDIQKYQNEQGQHYALPQLKVTSKKGPVDDLHQVVYTEIKPHSITQTGDQNIDCTSDRAVTPPPVSSHETATVAVCEPLTTDQLFSFLRSHASKWQSLWLALSLNDNRLDEVYTNNETDEDCLREMLELYMMRSDLNHSWEEVHAALEKIESSNQEAAVGKELQKSNTHKEEEENSDSDYSGSQLHSRDSSVVLEMEDDSSNLSQTSEELPEASEKNRSTLNPLSENLKADKQRERSDSGYDYTQQSESESSENSVALEMEDDSTSLSQAALDELLEASAHIPPLEDYESRVDPSFGSQATHTDGSEFGRPTIEELPMPPPSTPINSCSPGLQLERFCEQPEDEGDNCELCKIEPVHCQDSCIHDNYNEALIHQMGLLTDQKARDKLEYNDAVEESSPVHVNSEQALKSLDVDVCTPKTFSALDIPKVHELVPWHFSVSSKYSYLLLLTAAQLENDRFITLHFTCVILSVAYSSKLDAIINVYPVKVRVCCIMNIN